MLRGPAASWDEVQLPGLRRPVWTGIEICMQSGIVYKRRVKVRPQEVAVYPAPPATIAFQGKGHGTWQAPTGNFGLRSQRASAGPVRALVPGLSG